ncbi:hypothetical protein [Breznakiella homolactica]|uniref:Uncharacterized protein n=1 Tax=Breznakiella homolactica TaxID=2798577 RepID=A0A7T8BAS1_9SPIR|nr:hypothetical protein [Breznakiella homolactica]QQO09681.1 hypothetical protein JFL75_01820 [Breznakiella homolactica]
MDKKNQPFSAVKIFLLYIPASLVIILGFRMIFPDQAAPLPVFSFKWRLILGLIDFIKLFPALALSALVISFGLQRSPAEQFRSFSSQFLEIIKGHIITAIIATALYGLLFLLAYPLALDARSDMAFEGYLFRTSKERALEEADTESWPEAAQFLAICERIWPQSYETESLRIRVSIGLDELRLADGSGNAYGYEPRASLGIPEEWVPVDATEAYTMAQEAFSQERYYDAHWLATLAGRLARQGSAEQLRFSLLANEAWNAIASLEPNAREQYSYSLFHKKRDGYNALVSGDWIRAYYIFKELEGLTPQDPDVRNFLALSEDGVREIAFFIDEMDMAIGEILNGAIFSIPRTGTGGIPGGRLVIRFSSLSNFPDFSYVIGVEAIAFNRDGSMAFRVEAPYGKILPLRLDTMDERTRRTSTSNQLVLLMRTLDRDLETIQWGPEWTGPERPELSDTQMILNISYNDFLLSAKTHRGLESLSIRDLAAGAAGLGTRGHIPEVFQAEMLHRIAEPVILLPLAILVIIMGWRFRALRRPRYLGIPMLVIIPAVFAGMMAFLRYFSGSMGIWMILVMGFSAAMVVFCVFSLVLFVTALIILAGQHG